MKKNRGFTIVELVIVIAVIGILAAITLVSYSSVQRNADKSKAEATLQQVKLKLGEYYTDNNTYPANKGAISTYLTSVNATSLKADFDTVSASTSFTYAVTPAACTTACTGYTITLLPAYWSGTDAAIVITN